MISARSLAWTRKKAGFVKNCYSTVFFAEKSNLIGKKSSLIVSFFVKLISWARKTQFSQSCRSYFAKIRVFRCSDSEKNEKYCFSGKVSLFKIFSWSRKMQFSQMRRKKKLNSSFLSQSSETIERSISSSKKISHPFVPQDTENALLTLMALIFFLRIKHSSALSPKWWSILYTFQKNRFSSKCLLDTRNANMTTILEWIR